MTSTAAASTLPSTRSRKILEQAGIGLVSRFGAVAATMASTPIMLHLLGSRQFGAWLVLLSVFQWITMFDLGVAAGARNEIARAAAIGDEDRVREALTTGWLYAALVSLAIFAIAVIALTLTPLSRWLSTHVFDGVNVGYTLWLVAAGACLNFALSYIQSVFAALEKASAFSTFSLISNLGFLLLLLGARAQAVQRMEWIAVLYILAMVAGNAWLTLRFRKQYPQYRPRRAGLNHALRGSIMNFGLRLFFIQLAALVIFTTSRLMASLLLGPESVVVYDAGFKIFSLVTMVHTLLMSTMWSSFTHAFQRGEFQWIRATLRRLILLMLPIASACGVLAWTSPKLVTIWLGGQQASTIGLYSLFGVLTVLTCWSNIFAYFLNGIGDTRIQLISALVAGAVNIPATYLFTAVMHLKLFGIVLGTITSLAFFAVLGPFAVAARFKAMHKHR